MHSHHSHHEHHGHEHHEHHHGHGHHACGGIGEKILTVRPQSGLSGDMLLCGLACLLGLASSDLAELTKELNIEALENCVSIEPRMVNGVQGKGASVNLPHEHSHRTYKEIRNIIAESSMQEKAKELAQKTFLLLAEAEGFVHGKKADDVTFHEVGALDSILDICLVCSLYAKLDPDRFVCGALPLADGVISCAHGLLPSPAPAVLFLLENTAVCPFAGKGETVTPTAIALLKALGAEFGNWPAMKMEKNVLVYGSKVFENAPNGSIFAVGSAM